jgi:DNA-binding XRE family transcriptional regulator
MSYKNTSLDTAPNVLRLPKEMGQAFKTERKAQKRSQEWVAKKAGVSRFTVTQLERGENIGLHHLMALLAVLSKGLVLSGQRPTFEQLSEIYRDED